VKTNPEQVLQRVRQRVGVSDVGALLARDRRLRSGSVAIVPSVPEEIPALILLIETRKTRARVPLKFKRTPELLRATWPRVRWIVARRDGRLVGCIELRPVPEETNAWEIGSFSQAADNRNPRVLLRLWAAAFRELAALGARVAVVEIHRDNEPAWAFIARLPFRPDPTPSPHPEFVRYRMDLSAS
jgi:RimJ/RimL family protein N-acetyltransferase